MSETPDDSEEAAEGYVQAPHVKIMLFAAPGFFIGDAKDVKRNEIIGRAGEDKYIYALDSTRRIGFFHWNGDCFLFTEEGKDE